MRPIERDRPGRAWLCVLMACMLGCNGANGRDVDEPAYEPAGRSPAEALDAYIEAELMARLPAVDESEHELMELRLERRQLARDMAEEAGATLAPFALVAALLVPDGPLDLPTPTWSRTSRSTRWARRGRRCRPWSRARLWTRGSGARSSAR